MSNRTETMMKRDPRDTSFVEFVTSMFEEESLLRLPLPNVESILAARGPEAYGPEHVFGVVHDPVFAGAGPFPPVVTDERWVATARSLIREEGETQFLVNLLCVLRESFQAAEAGIRAGGNAEKHDGCEPGCSP